MSDDTWASEPFPLPAGGIDALIATLHHRDAALPVAVYERADPDTRVPLTTWIGLRGQHVGVKAGERPFDALRRVLAGSAASDRVVAQISYPDRPHGPGTGSFLRLTDYLRIDHVTASAVVVTRGEPDAALLAGFAEAVAGPRLDHTSVDADFAWRPNLGEAEFSAAVERLQSSAAGDERGGVVLSVPMRSAVRADAVESYRALRAINPSTMMFLFRTPDLELWGSTSLSLVEVADGELVAETDGATRQFSADEPEAEWIPTPKEIYEYDVVARALEEDVAGVARQGTLRFVRELEQRRFFRLGHLFAQVRAELADGVDAVAVVEALFPHGAAVGHPRAEALAAIAKLERLPRGPYAGCVGVFGSDGSADVAAVIRSIWTTESGTATRAGAKVVPASDPAEEYQESIIKTRATRESVRRELIR